MVKKTRLNYYIKDSTDRTLSRIAKKTGKGKGTIIDVLVANAYGTEKQEYISRKKELLTELALVDEKLELIKKEENLQ